MEFKTTDEWDSGLWQKASSIYREAFGYTGAKPDKVIQNMFRKHICFLHVLSSGKDMIGISITGKLQGSKALLIDYIAIRKDFRGQGLGLMLVKQIKDWSITHEWFDSLLIEVESEPTSENLARIRFWEKCGFSLTDYVHHYIWVPEPYQAMYVKLLPDAQLPSNGEALFQFITEFHKESFRQK